MKIHHVSRIVDNKGCVKITGDLTVSIKGGYRFDIPSNIDIDSNYHRQCIRRGYSYMLAESTCLKLIYTFTDRSFYKLGKQLAKM